MKGKLILIFISLIFANAFSQVRISEVMYAPTSPMKEWFEIYNTGINTLDLNSWVWRNSSSPNQYRTITYKHIFLYPETYAIVCNDSNNLKQYFPGITGIILQSDGWSALVNTGYESVEILNSYSQKQDSLTYSNSWGGNNGFSLERKFILDSTNLQTNWGTCIDPFKGTPNRINSITPKDYDLILKSFTITPVYPIVGDSLKLSFTIRNTGLNSATDFSLNIYRDINFDSINQPSELINSQNYSNLNQNDSIKYNFLYQIIDTGLIQFIGLVMFPPDLDTGNNKLLKAVQVYSSMQGPGIIINEIMYANTTTTEKEWFEIYNRDTVPINLAGISWKDATSSVNIITNNNVLLNSHQYAIVCQDSIAFKQHHPGITGYIFQTNWSSLNDNGDDIVLIKSVITQQRYDSVHYLPGWGGNSGGYSLERIDASGPSNNQNNWGTSIDILKSTPNRQNSITPKFYDLFLKNFTITPNNPKIGDSLKLSFTIKNTGINPANNFSLNIYRDLNLDSIPQISEMIKTQSFLNLNHNDSINFNYSFLCQDTGLIQLIGLVEYQPDLDTLNNKLVKSIYISNTQSNIGIIINEIMYNPKSPEPEWIELFNNSNIPISLKNWKIADSSSINNPVLITSNDFIIQQNSFVVIAKNNSIISKHPSIDTSKIIYLSNLPTYNNDKDVVAIYNNSGMQVDYVSYKSGWGGASKNSLERISPNKPSNDSTNWGTSLIASIQVRQGVILILILQLTIKMI